MKKINKIQFLLTFLFLLSYNVSLIAQGCFLDDLAKDLKNNNALGKYLNENPIEGYTVWEIVYKGGGKTTDIELLDKINTLYKKIDKTDLLLKINKLDNISKFKFLEDFANTGDGILKRLNQHSELVDVWKIHTPKGQKLLAENADIWIKHREAIPLLKNKEYEKVAELFGGKIVYKPEYKGFVNKMTSYEIEETMKMINRTDDIPKITKNLGISEDIVREVKQHYWIKQHLVKTDDGFIIGRFGKTEGDFGSGSDFELWNEMINGFNRREKKEALNLLAHEYVEAQLMKKGMSYRSMNKVYETDIYDIGAHDIAPKAGSKGYFNPERNNNPILRNEQLTNLNQIVKELIDLYQIK